MQGSNYARGLSEEDANMIKERCSSVREYQPAVLNDYCIEI